MRSSKFQLLALFTFCLWLSAVWPAPSSSLAQQAHPPSPEDNLAVALVAAASDDERQALVSAQPQLVNQRFRHALAMRVLRLQMKGDHQQVLATLEFVRKLAEARNDKGWVAMTWIDSVGSYDLAGQKLRALAAYRKVPPPDELAPDRQAQAHVLGVRAFLAREQGRQSVALADCQRSLTLFEPEQKLEIALAYGILGMIYVKEAESEDAPKYLNESLRLFAELGDRFWTAIPLNYLGEHYHYRGDEARAIDYLRRSAAVSEEFGIGFLRYYTYNLLGEAYARNGEAANALLYLERGLAEREALRDQRKISKALKDLGLFYRTQENYGQALEYLERSLALSTAAQYHEMASVGHRQIGLVWFELGETATALTAFQKALAEAEQDTLLEENGMSLQEIGRAHYQLGQTEQALAAWQQALALPEHPGQHAYRGEILNSVGELYLQQKNLPAAERYFQQCLASLAAAYRINPHHVALAGLGEVCWARSEYEQAAQHYERAYELAEKFAPTAATHYLTRLGELQRVRQQDEKALQSFQRAIVLNEAWRARLANPEWRALSAAQRRSPYELYLDLLLHLHQRQPAQGYAATALQASEGARARSLLEMLTEARTDIRAGLDPALLARERALKARLNARAAEQFAPTYNNARRAAELARELAELTAELRKVETQIRSNSPRYAALTQPQPLATKELQQLLDADTLLLEYALGDERSWLFAVAPDALHVYQLPPRQEIEAAARSLASLLAAPPRTAQPNVELPRQAHALSRMLLAPAAAQLGKKRLLIVAAGALQYLPFAVLPEPVVETGKQSKTNNLQSAIRNPQSAPPLLVNHEIVSLPSASTLAVLRRETAGRPSAPKAVAVLADPVFSADDPRVKKSGAPLVAASRTSTRGESAPLERTLRSFKSLPERAGLARLLLSRDEANEISAAAPTGDGWKALDFQASRATATSSELSRYRIIHFATHGLLNTAQPELSGLVFSLVDEQGQPQDGFLRLHDVYNLKLNAELVVLSACQTGLGKEVKGEGLVGLTRGFMYAGATRVAASLWKVDDYATSALMKRFYRGLLQEKLRPAAALRQAQLEMWRRRQWQAPFYWGAFVLQGEWK